MLIISLPIAVFMFLASKVKFYQVLYFVGILLILHLCFSAEIMRATRECERIHNNISWGIEFDYNCEKEDKKKSDADSADADKHMCFIMRWYCARRCTMSVYDRKCSVESLFTLNLEEDDGTPVTLDCVCTYRKYKRGCLSTYQFLWSDVLTEFESNCAKQVLVTTKKPDTRKPAPRIPVYHVEGINGFTGDRDNFYMTDKAEYHRVRTQPGWHDRNTAFHILAANAKCDERVPLYRLYRIVGVVWNHCFTADINKKNVNWRAADPMAPLKSPFDHVKREKLGPEVKTWVPDIYVP